MVARTSRTRSTTRNTRIEWRRILVAPALAGMLAFALIASIGGGLAFAQPTLHIGVDLDENAVRGGGWAPSAEIQISIDDTGTVASPDFATTVDSDADGGFWSEELAFRISAGQVVTVTDGITTREHTVLAIRVTGVDPDTDIVSGTADPGSSVWVGIGGQFMVRERYVTADGTGTWSTDFSVDAGSDPLESAYDIVPGESGAASRSDGDGDFTFVRWYVPSPKFSINPVTEWLSGDEWPADEDVLISVDDPATLADPDLQTSATCDGEGHFERSLGWLGLDVRPGCVLRVTDGSTTKEHEVTVGVASADADHDTVTGTATPGSWLWVDLRAFGGAQGSPARYVQADSAGEWTADFSTATGLDDWQKPYDLEPGCEGAVYSRDGDGDETRVEWVARPSTTLARTSSAATINYGSSYSFKGTLKAGSMALVGERVVLESSTNGVTFSLTPLSATTRDGGAFTFSVKPTIKTWYRVRFAETSFYQGSTSSAVAVSVKASVSTPIAPATMSHDGSYTVYGFLKPRHAGGSYAVRIYKYRYASGTWKSYGYVNAKASNYSSYSKYSASMKLPYAGKWRLRAYHADAGHAAGWSSGYDYVTVE